MNTGDGDDPAVRSDGSAKSHDVGADDRRYSVAHTRKNGHKVSVSQHAESAADDSPNAPAKLNLREGPGIIVGIVASTLAVVQFFIPDMTASLRIGVILSAVIIALYFSFTWSSRLPFVLALVAAIVFTITLNIISRPSQPSARQRYVQEYLAGTRTANIWYGQVVMNKFAPYYILNHYSAFDPHSIAYPHNLPGARLIELEKLVGDLTFNAHFDNRPVVTMGQVERVSFAGLEPGPIDDPEYVIQLVPLSPNLSRECKASRFGGLQLEDAHGSLADLYPTRSEHPARDNMDVYVRIHPLPIPIPHLGDVMTVRGLPIAYGQIPTANGHLFSTIYIAGSSATIGDCYANN